MKQFSHSKLNTYERCPLNYKYKYVIKLKEEGADTIEAFVGSRVHDVLELLYRDLMKTKQNSLKDLLRFYDRIWRVEWKDSIVFPNKKYNKKHSYNYGKQCITNYYNQYRPFDNDTTLAVEKKVSLIWGDYEITGFIDRLSRIEKGIYAVRDYKTGAIMDQKYADKDRQLALYAMFVKQNYRVAKKIKLIWHFVGVGEDVESTRTDKQYKKLKAETLALIDEIEQAETDDDFPAKETMCRWCGYWQHCPKKKHLYKVEKLPKNKYLKESGVKLAKKYIELNDEKAKINKQARTSQIDVAFELDKVKEAILKYSFKHSLEALEYQKRLVVINKKKKHLIPKKTSDLDHYNQLEAILKKSKHWKTVSSITDAKLSKFLTSNQIEVKLKKQIIELAPLTEEISLSVKKK